MKFFALTAIAAAIAAVSATPAGHMNLAKRAAIATQTMIEDGNTYVQVVEGAVATTNAYTTVFKTVLATETAATYIFSYSGDDASVVARLQSALADIVSNAVPADAGLMKSMSGGDSFGNGAVDGLLPDTGDLIDDQVDDIIDEIDDLLNDTVPLIGDTTGGIGGGRAGGH